MHIEKDTNTYCYASLETCQLYFPVNKSDSLSK